MEQNVARRNVYNSLVQVPHREYGPSVELFREAMADDPHFVSRACVYLNTPESSQTIRDIQDVAAITLLQAEDPEYREAGRCVLLGLGGMLGFPPFRILRVLTYLSQSDRKVPRQARSIFNQYVSIIEGEPVRLDGVMLRNRRAMKEAWVRYHLDPRRYPRTHAILFAKPPVDSKLSVLKEIANCPDPNKQARLVAQHRIPYVVAASIMPKITPAVGVALIESMSPTEAVNSRAWVEQSGLLNNEEIRDLYLGKVAQARGSVASMTDRKSAQGEDVAVQTALDLAREEAVKGSQRIQRSTLLLVDRSGSMEAAIEVAKRFGSRISPLCDGLMVVAFNDEAVEIRPRGSSLKDWEMSFRNIYATGYTSVGIGLQYALRKGFQPDQIVIITDEAENTSPLLVDVLKKTELSPEISILTLGTNRVLTEALEKLGFRVNRFEVVGDDYYVFDQVAALLGGPQGKSLVERILDVTLPKRPGWEDVSSVVDR